MVVDLLPGRARTQNESGQCNEEREIFRKVHGLVAHAIHGGIEGHVGEDEERVEEDPEEKDEEQVQSGLVELLSRLLPVGIDGYSGHEGYGLNEEESYVQPAVGVILAQHHHEPEPHPIDQPQQQITAGDEGPEDAAFMSAAGGGASGCRGGQTTKKEIEENGAGSLHKTRPEGECN